MAYVTAEASRTCSTPSPTRSTSSQSRSRRSARRTSSSTSRPADRLEAQLFRPVQVAYGRAQRTHTGFAERHGLPTRTWTPAQPGHPSQGVKGFLETAVAAVDECDAALADLQDTMLPVEVGDPELRAGLAEVRELVGHLRHDARELVRTLGR